VISDEKMGESMLYASHRISRNLWTDLALEGSNSSASMRATEGLVALAVSLVVVAILVAL
jgi:hypothetical protein